MDDYEPEELRPAWPDGLVMVGVAALALSLLTILITLRGVTLEYAADACLFRAGVAFVLIGLGLRFVKKR